MSTQFAEPVHLLALGRPLYKDEREEIPGLNAIATVAFGEEHAAVALDAYSRFGKGRHPAAWV
jgi:uncharacterized protein with PIN domain